MDSGWFRHWRHDGRASASRCSSCSRASCWRGRSGWRSTAASPMPSIRIYALRRAARILPGYWLALTVTLRPQLHALRRDARRRTAAPLPEPASSSSPTGTGSPVSGRDQRPALVDLLRDHVLRLLPFCLARSSPCRPRSRAAGSRRLVWLGVIAAALGAHWLFVELLPDRRGPAGLGLRAGRRRQVWMPRLQSVIGFFAMFAVGALAAGVQVRLAATALGPLRHPGARRHRPRRLVAVASTSRRPTASGSSASPTASRGSRWASGRARRRAVVGADRARPRQSRRSRSSRASRSASTSGTIS